MAAGVWRRISQATTAHPVRTDVLLAAGLAGVSVLQGWAEPIPLGRPFDLAATLLTLGITLPTALRRRAPMTVMLVCAGFAAWYAALGYYPGTNTYGTLLTVYTVATVGPWWRVLIAGTIFSTIWAAANLAGGWTTVPALIAQCVVIPGALWKIGDNTRRLAEAGEVLARRAVVEERLRIARELHDVVAHHMSVIAVQAGLARYVLRSDPDTADAALGTVLDTGGEALDELRRLLEVLRLGPPTGDDGLEAAPGLAYLPELLNRVRAAGVPVELTVTGTPQPLPSGVELCAYRIIQESLTNVLKHAAPATARVHLQHGGTELIATITDDGTSAHRRPGRTHGHGLIGMRERAMLYGGSLRAGARAGGGFEVRMVLPVTEPEE